MSERVFEILRSAVNLARFDQIRKVDALRARLAQRHPNSEQEISEALSFWTAQARREAN